MRCQLCGTEFEPQATGCHDKCPMGSHCQLICCPNCGYQTVDTTKSTTARLLTRVMELVRRKRAAAPETQATLQRLSDLPVGARAILQSLDALPPQDHARLIAFGLVPGSEVKVCQRRPAPVIRCDETELAIGHEILDRIMVRLIDPSIAAPDASAGGAHVDSI